MNKKILFIVLLVTLASILLFLLKSNGLSTLMNPLASAPVKVDDSGVTPEGIANTVAANNQFALDFYASVNKDTSGENIFFSPYSLSTALSMTYEGAKGQTAEEILSVFQFPADDVARHSSAAAIYNQLNKKGTKYKLLTANALWVQQNFELLPEFTDVVHDYYGGEATTVDFVDDTEAARLQINRWVAGKTNNMIKNLLSEGAVDERTRLVLTNAVYFKGNWFTQFHRDDTTDEEFRVLEDKTVMVPMMSSVGEESRYGYTETDELQVLELLYEGGDLSMLVLLPKDDMSTLEGRLSTLQIEEWRNSLREKLVHVYFPKFTFENKYILNENLSAMGMPTAFSNKADFSGMTGNKDLQIGAVIHQAFVEVNEEGTEAAAATAVGDIVTLPSFPGSKIPVFRADHPFLFLIMDREKGQILFMGKVVDPSKADD